jgi:hypothetical protein
MMVKISDERKRALSMTMINQVIDMQQQAINNGRSPIQHAPLHRLV